MEKINIAELLKDCPKGMELDCTMYENTSFIGLTENVNFPIRVRINFGDTEEKSWTKEITLTSEGKLGRHPNAKCIIFPKGKTTWEEFQKPFKDGDILVVDDTIYIYNGVEELSPYLSHYVYVAADKNGLFAINTSTKSYGARLVTEEEKQKLFDAIKENGYRWNPETKTLEKLIKPIFKKGDKVRVRKGFSEPRIIEDVCDTFYTLVPVGKIDFTDQDNWELVPNKFDISKLKPFEEVLFRMHDKDTWCNGFYSFYKHNHHFVNSLIITRQCIPYKGNEHLLNTTDKCNEFYETWE